MACCIFLATLIATSRAWLSKNRQPPERRRGRAVRRLETWSAAWVIAAAGYMILGVVASLGHDGLVTWRVGHDVFLGVLGFSLLCALKLIAGQPFAVRDRSRAVAAVGPLWLVISTIDVHALGNPSLVFHGPADVAFHGGGFLIAGALALVDHLMRPASSPAGVR